MKIALFFTEGISLKSWHDTGVLYRDSLLYERLIAMGHEVVFVTYGGENDPDYLPPNSKIQVLTRPAEMGLRDYSWKIHRIHGHILKDADIIKSHQVNGARYAAYAKLRLGNKPYIARCGYLPSYFMAQEKAPFRARLRNWIEEFIAFHMADAICVPSEAEIRYLRRHYGIRTQKAHACPNWVDTDFFKPDNESIKKHPRRICFVGRFEAQKDPLLLIEALRDLENIELLMIGGGTMKAQIEAKIMEYGISATVLDRVDNENLPRYLNESAIYALPTRYEGGSPKTLFEAMACALPVIGTDGFGVNEAFEDGVHGYKIPVGDAAALRNAIQQLLDNPDHARKLGTQARQHVIGHYSIDHALERELKILQLVSRHRPLTR
ncbi:MAG TPA: glycosyltransferase family 4 protein [Aggregatilineales bacterium]|nr:glycosyltransferase family 4 protein [Aggregatilineales bacterium]